MWPPFSSRGNDGRRKSCSGSDFGTSRRARRWIAPRVFDGSLEARRLLSVSPVINGVLTITGDPNNPNQSNDFALALDAGVPDTLDITLHGSTETQSLDGITQIAVVGLAGNDQLTIDDSNGLILVPIQYDGGGGINALALVQTGGGAQSSETYNVGALTGMGVDTVVGPGAAASPPVQVAAFENVATITTSIRASSLSIAPAAAVFGLTGSLLNGRNAITVGQSPSPGFGIVLIDNAAPIAFANKMGLAVNSGPGTDTISVDSTSAPTGLTEVTITGGDPGAGDILVYNAPHGSTSTITVLPGAQGAGAVAVAPDPSPQNVHFNNIGNLKIAASAALGDALDIEGTTGNDTYFFTPGSSSDSGTVTGTLDANNATGLGPFALPVLTFSGIPPSTSSTFGGVTFGAINAEGEGTATLVYNGPVAGASVAVSSPQSIPSGVRIAALVGGQLSSAVNGFALANLVVDPGPGGGAVTVAGGVNVPVEIHGSGLASPPLTFKGDGATTVVLDLGAGTVEEAGHQPVTFTGITALDVDANGAGAAVFGTTGPDDLIYTPTGAQAATVTVAGSGLTARFANVATELTLDPRGGGDTIGVAGTAGSDMIRAASIGAAPGLPTVSVGVLLPMTFNVFDTQNLVIDDGNGSDDLTVDSSANPFPIPIIDRGNQSSLTLTGGAAMADVYTPGPAAGVGTSAIAIGNVTQTVAFTGLARVLDTVAGPLTIAGTAANDVVNYGPGSSATTGLVTVGSFESVEFSNKTTLSLEAGSGDDRITVNNPSAPTGLTTIAVDGGPGNDTLVVNALGNAVNVAIAGMISVASQRPVNYTNVEQVQILNAPDQPLSSAPATVQGTAGTPLSNVLAGSFSDTGPGSQASAFTASINWGDGTPATIGQVGAVSAATFQVFGSHTYATAATYAVVVSVTENGGSGTIVVSGVPIAIMHQGVSTVAIASQATIIPAPLEPQAQPVFGTAGIPISPGTLVATFVDVAGASAVGSLTAQVDSGNGPVAANVNLVAGSTSSFQVTTATPITFPVLGTFPIRVMITDSSGAPSTSALTIATATIAAAPLTGVATDVLNAIQGTPLVAAIVASFTDANPLDSPDNYRAMIDWGDGSPTSIGTIVQAGAAGTPLVVLGNHTYAESGVYPVTTTIDAAGGSLLTLTNTAPVAGVPIILTGQLDPSSDSGESNTDAITKINQPSFSGTSSPSSIIRLFAQPTAGGSAIQVGQTAADASGAWRIRSNLLSDGSYVVFATALDPAGHTPTRSTIVSASSPLVIDTVGPRVTRVFLDRAHGQIDVTFQDNRSGMDQASLRNAVNITLSKRQSRTPGTFRLTNIAVHGAGNPMAPEEVVLTIRGSHLLRGGTYTLTVFSGAGVRGVRDVAGNALDGEFSGVFPSGNSLPGGHFVAALDAIHGRVFAPKPVVGSGSPVVPLMPAQLPVFNPGNSGVVASKLGATRHPHPRRVSPALLAVHDFPFEQFRLQSLFGR